MAKIYSPVDMLEQESKYKKVIEILWNIIDDIDTMSDMAKNDDVGYRKQVEKIQYKRWETGITTDGYELNYENCEELK